MDVTLTWPGVKQQPDLPALGLSFQLNPRLSHVRYYGLGPDDCYADRCTGALLGWHEYDVQDGMTRYAKPQESGNRMGVRRLEITGQRRPRCRRFRARAGDQRSALSAEELACAYHADELPLHNRTVLDVALFRKGIGGDDSWGAPRAAAVHLSLRQGLHAVLPGGSDLIKHRHNSAARRLKSIAAASAELCVIALQSARQEENHGTDGLEGPDQARLQGGIHPPSQ